MNHNQWQVSYEHEILHSGNIELPYLRDCQRFIDQAAVYAGLRGQKLSVSFTGGEVTEWLDFEDLLAHCKTQGAETRFVTNLNLDLERFQGLLSYTDSLLIEVHPGYTSTGHLLFCLAKIAETTVSAAVNVNMTLEHWAEQVELCDRIKTKFPRINLRKKMLFKDPIFNTTPQAYDQKQVQALKAQQGDIRVEGPQGTEYTDAQTLILEDRNRFQGYQCWAGLEQVVVDAWGAVHRGHCRKSGFMGYIKDPAIYWYPEPLICALPACVNQFDLLATKQSL